MQIAKKILYAQVLSFLTFCLFIYLVSLGLGLFIGVTEDNLTSTLDIIIVLMISFFSLYLTKSILKQSRDPFLFLFSQSSSFFHYFKVILFMNGILTFLGGLVSLMFLISLFPEVQWQNSLISFSDVACFFIEITFLFTIFDLNSAEKGQPYKFKSHMIGVFKTMGLIVYIGGACLCWEALSPLFAHIFFIILIGAYFFTGSTVKKMLSLTFRKMFLIRGLIMSFLFLGVLTGLETSIGSSEFLSRSIKKSKWQGKAVEQITNLKEWDSWLVANEDRYSVEEFIALFEKLEDFCPVKTRSAPKNIYCYSKQEIGRTIMANKNWSESEISKLFGSSSEYNHLAALHYIRKLETIPEKLHKKIKDIEINNDNLRNMAKLSLKFKFPKDYEGKIYIYTIEKPLEKR